MIISGKLNPPELPKRWVTRPRLATHLRELAESHHVVWVCATAGAGKTTAVVEALSDSDIPVAWLTLDSADGAPGRLLNYLEAALAHVYPDLDGVASNALAARTPHVEAAGLLADAIADRPVVLVLDQLERLTDAAAALEVLGAFLRYAPRSTHTVLTSRRELLLEIHSTSAWANVVRVGEADLAFTVPEAREALALRDSEALDAEGAVAATGGWVTGVLFEAWRSEEHVYGAGGEADPLHGYLAAHILADLDEDQRRFLIQTALLDEVSVRRAEALGLANVGARLAELRGLHLPASWSENGKAVTFHPRLREYLLELLGREGDAETNGLRRRYVQLLRDEHRSEEATDLLIELGDLDEALVVAEEAIGSVLLRLDLTVAERWIAALTPGPGASSRPLAAAELMVAVGREEYAKGTAVSDRLVSLLDFRDAYNEIANAGRAHVSHNSGNNEWYTPKEYIAAARLVLGEIDLDPASSAVANDEIKAKAFYTSAQNGLKQPWRGRVWLNPPYAQPAIEDFALKFAASVTARDVTAGLVLVNNATETEWFGTFSKVAAAVCFPEGRVRFWSPDRESATPLQGQAVLYVGDRVEVFRKAFRPFGVVLIKP